MKAKDGATKLSNLITDALAIEAEAAKDADALGFMARALVQATLPHSRSDASVFERHNGAFRLAIMAHPSKRGFALRYLSAPRTSLAHHRGCPHPLPGIRAWANPIRVHGRAWVNTDGRTVGDNLPPTRSDAATLHGICVLYM